MVKQIITDVQTFDGEVFIGRKDIVIADDKIEAVVEPGTADISGAQVIDGSGLTATPGFIDCHIHVCSLGVGDPNYFVNPFSYPMYRSVENLRKTLHGGVTSARDAGGTDAGARLAVADGSIAGPKLKIAITIMSQTGGHADGWMPSGTVGPLSIGHPGRPAGPVNGPLEVQKQVREIMRAGADQIKMCVTGGVMDSGAGPQHSEFSPEEIEAAVKTAHSQGRYVMAHAQGTAGIKIALRAGVKSIEHGTFLDDEAIQLMLDKDAYLVPTLQAARSILRAADAGLPLAPESIRKAHEAIDQNVASVRAAHAAGVKIAMGTDAGVGPHGENLEELEIMAEIGLPVEAVLRAGTSTPAELIGEADSVGHIAPGFAADIVLSTGDLQADGVADLRKRVLHVFQDGVKVR